MNEIAKRNQGLGSSTRELDLNLPRTYEAAVRLNISGGDIFGQHLQCFSAKITMV
jgi:hypothetical protein